MIDLNVNSDPTNKLFQEGILKDSLKAAADIDVDKIKQDWQNASSGIEKLNAVNKGALEKGKDLADEVEKYRSKWSANTSSIIARARNSVLQFPIYITQTIRYNEAHIIGKMFERVYTTLVQTVLSQNPIMDEEEANNLVFLKKFHTNLKEAADVFVNKYYEPIDDIDRMMCESVFYEQKLSENCVVRFSAVPTVDQDLILENARLMNEPLAGFMYLQEALTEEEKKQTDSTLETSSKTVILSDKDLQDMAVERDKLKNNIVDLANSSAEDIRKEVKAELGDGPSRDKSGSNATEVENHRKKIDQEVQDRLRKHEAAKDQLDNSIKQLKDDIKYMQDDEESLDKKVSSGQITDADKKRILELQKSHPYISFRNGQYRRQEDMKKKIIKPHDHRETPVNRAVDAPRLNKDSEIKKFNGLLPYTMEASFRIRTKNGLDREVKYIIGVKSVLHMFRAQDLAEDLRELITGDIHSLRKVRYKTGELSFKDYFFNIKGLKADAAKNINYNKRWLNTLKRLGEYKKQHGSFMKKPIEAMAGGNVPIPNGTMVLSQPDVDTLTSQTGIDISVVANAKRLARSLFLIAVVIVDDVRGTMNVLFPDSDNEWDVQSLAAIDADLAKTDNSQLMRELNHMVNR